MSQTNFERWKSEIEQITLENMAKKMKCDFCPKHEGCRALVGGNCLKKCEQRLLAWAMGNADGE